MDLASSRVDSPVSRRAQRPARLLRALSVGVGDGQVFGHYLALRILLDSFDLYPTDGFQHYHSDFVVVPRAHSNHEAQVASFRGGPGIRARTSG